MKKHLLVLLLIIMSQTGFAQIGGRHVYEFLHLSPSARVSALGGNLITIRDDDISQGFANPATLNPDMHQHLAFNHSFYLGGVHHGYVAYGQFHEPWQTTFHGGVQYISYGEFAERNEAGLQTGTFKAAEYALTLGAGYTLYERLSVGANLKLVTSQLEGYNSFGVVSDWAAMFHDTSSQITATLVFKNVGGQITAYRDGNREAVPFEIQAGISKRLRYLPFRFSVIYNNLERWNILYDDPTQVESGFLFEDGGEDGNMQLDNFFRHFVFNGEFLFGKKENLRLRFGYSHLRRKELSVKNYRSLAGFSFGAGIKVNRFRIDYGYSSYHLAGGLSHFSISTSLQEFKKG